MKKFFELKRDIWKKYRKQARMLVCITEPLLCYMNSECVLESIDTPTAGNNLIPISVPLQCSCVGCVPFHTCI